MSREAMDHAMAKIGFTVQETGGGCQAYQRPVPVSLGIAYELVTAADDPTLPESFESPIMYGLYTELEDESGFAETSRRSCGEAPRLTLRLFIAESTLNQRGFK